MGRWVGWVWLMAVWFLGGCATSVDPATVRTAVGDKAIALVVTVPNELNLSWVGTTPLNNESAKLVSAEWPVRTWIEEQVVTQLRQSGDGRSVRVLVLQPGEQIGMDRLIDPSKELALLVSAGYGPDAVFNRPPYVSGVGVRQHSSFGFAPASASFVRLDGFLRDMTRQDVAFVASSESFQRLPYVALGKGPVLNPSVEQSVRDSVRSQISAVVFDLLARFGLIDAGGGSPTPSLPTTAPGVRG